MRSLSIPFIKAICFVTNERTLDSNDNKLSNNNNLRNERSWCIYILRYRYIHQLVSSNWISLGSFQMIHMGLFVAQYFFRARTFLSG